MYYRLLLLTVAVFGVVANGNSDEAIDSALPIGNIKNNLVQKHTTSKSTTTRKVTEMSSNIPESREKIDLGSNKVKVHVDEKSSATTNSRVLQEKTKNHKRSIKGKRGVFLYKPSPY